MKLKELHERIIASLALKTFSFWQAIGIHVVPRHFYEPVPDTRLLSDELWKEVSDLTRIDINQENQLALLKNFVLDYMHICHPNELKKAFPSYESNPHNPGAFWTRRCN